MNNIYMFTGLSSSGKSTIARMMRKRIGIDIIDGDEIRKKTHNSDFSWEGRKSNMLYAAYTASRLSKYNSVVIAMINPVCETREMIKDMYDVIEIYIDCDIDECIKRDKKGLYKKKNFTGIGSSYEIPETPHIIVNTKYMSVKQCVDMILEE